MVFETASGHLNYLCAVPVGLECEFNDMSKHVMSLLRHERHLEADGPVPWTTVVLSLRDAEHTRNCDRNAWIYLDVFLQQTQNRDV